MKYKEFQNWCNERYFDACWGFHEAIMCSDILDKMDKVHFYKRKNKWKELEPIAKEIVDQTNEKMLQNNIYNKINKQKLNRNKQIPEEEIIRNIKHWLNITNYNRKKEYNNNIDNYIKGLLDLYNKEKEKNNKLVVVYGSRSYGKTLKAKDYITKEYISKDKIRTLIKMYEHDIKELEAHSINEINTNFERYEIHDRKLKIEAYKFLLLGGQDNA